MTIPGDISVVVGLGCSTAASASEIVGLIEGCLAETGLESRQIKAFATHIRKHDSRALKQAAAHFDLPLLFLGDAGLAPGVPGTCEAVAAAAGPLLLGKRKTGHATCAIALAGPDFDLASFGQPANPSAAIASSTLATSLAGP